MRSCGSLRLRPDLWVGLLHHLFAEIHADQVVLKDVVIEHVFGGFAQVHNPFRDRWRPDTEGHVLGISCAGGMVVAADAANAAGNEVGISRIFTLHEDTVSTEDRRRAVTLGNLPVLEINFGENSQAAHDPGDRIPIHLHQISFLGGCVLRWRGNRAHSIAPSVRAGVIARGQFGARMPPLWFLVDGGLG